MGGCFQIATIPGAWHSLPWAQPDLGTLPERRLVVPFLAPQMVEFRPFVMRDLQAVARCAAAAFDGSCPVDWQWYERFLRFDLHPRNSAVAHAAFEKAQCVGYVVAMANRDRAPMRPRIEELGVIPEYRRRGVASRLMQNCLARLEHEYQPVAVEIRTQSDNQAARALYLKMGFRVNSHLTAEENYDDSMDEDKMYGTDMVVMLKRMKGRKQLIKDNGTSKSWQCRGWTMHGKHPEKFRMHV